MLTMRGWSEDSDFEILRMGVWWKVADQSADFVLDY